MSDKKQGINKKQLFIMGISMMLVAAISVGATLAYLSTTTDITKNIFTGSEGIGLELSEPNYQSTKANGYTPGTVIKKDPILTNTTSTSAGDTTEWVAMKVTYCSYDSATQESTPITYTEMQKYIAPIAFNTTDWTEIAGGADTDKYVIYMYNTAIAEGVSTTNALFQQVQILSQADLKTKWNSETDFMKDFDIQVAGAAIKNEQSNTTFSAVDSTEQGNIKSALIALFPATV